MKTHPSSGISNYIEIRKGSALKNITEGTQLKMEKDKKF